MIDKNQDSGRKYRDLEFSDIYIEKLNDWTVGIVQKLLYYQAKFYVVLSTSCTITQGHLALFSIKYVYKHVYSKNVHQSLFKSSDL